MFESETILLFVAMLVAVVTRQQQQAQFPRIVWQTHRKKQLPSMALLFTNTWRTTNPSWNVKLLDDDDARRFIAQHFDADHVAAFESYPVGVMRADFWRYCVLFKEGGVYADVDTLSEEPIESWLMGGTRGLVVGVENDKHLAQWTLAAKPNHPALAAVIAEVMRRSTEPRCRSIGQQQHFVHYCTGPAVFTDAVLRYANVTSIGQLTTEVAASMDMFVHPQHVLNGQAVQHVFASIAWRAPYESWRKAASD